MLYGGASGPLRCCAFLICLLFCGGAGALAFFSSVVCCRVVLFVFLFAVWCPSSSVWCLCLLFVGGALALPSTILCFLDLSSFCWWGLGRPLRSCAFLSVSCLLVGLGLLSDPVFSCLSLSVSCSQLMVVWRSAV